MIHTCMQKFTVIPIFLDPQKNLNSDTLHELAAEVGEHTHLKQLAAYHQIPNPVCWTKPPIQQDQHNAVCYVCLLK